MTPLATIFVVGVAVTAISIGIMLFDDVVAELVRRRRQADFAAIILEMHVSRKSSEGATGIRTAGSPSSPRRVNRATGQRRAPYVTR